MKGIFLHSLLKEHAHLDLERLKGLFFRFSITGDSDRRGNCYPIITLFGSEELNVRLNALPSSTDLLHHKRSKVIPLER